MNQYRYQLDKSSNKYLCPNCGKKRFVPYVDTEKGELLPEIYGRCDREAKCGYHLNPYQNEYAKMIWQQENQGFEGNWQLKRLPPTPPKPAKKQAFIPWQVLAQTLQGYSQNTFVQNLANCVPYPLPAKDIERVIEAYYLGTITNGYMKGAVCFPFIDQQNRVCAIQAKTFDAANHTKHTNFLHALLAKEHETSKTSLPDWLEAYQQNDKKVSCLFGEHLLPKYPDNPVALVEAPKTAIYGSLYFGLPNDQANNLLWLAVYNLSSLTLDKCRVLQNRDVYLFPDLSKDGKAFDLWQTKAQELTDKMPGTRFIVSDLLERYATKSEKQKGLDLADYLIKLDWRQFRKEAETSKTREKSVKREAPKKSFFSPNHQKQVCLDTGQNTQDDFFANDTPNKLWDIESLESFFANLPALPNKPIILNQGITITDIQAFINSHLAVLKANNGKKKFKPYFERLEVLRALCKF